MARRCGKVFPAALLFVWSAFSAGSASGQEAGRILPVLTARIDSTNQTVKEVIELWVNYLNSKPDSLYDNPYWSESEKKKYPYFDFTAKLMYQAPSGDLLQSYLPTILAVEPEGERYSIRTLFYAEGPELSHSASNTWCLLRVYAERENGNWKLRNALPVLTENWKKKKLGKITFIYPPEHRFDEKRARRSAGFCDSVAKTFSFPDWKPFEFYVTSSKDELGRILGFDYFFAGITSGVTQKANGFLISGFGSEWYPHELTHMVVEAGESTHRMVNEGLATCLGGQMGRSLKENLRDLADTLSKDSTVSFDDILNYRVWIGGAYYSAGAVLCKMALEKGGPGAIKTLLVSGKENADLYRAIENILALKPEDFNVIWRKKVFEYAK